MMSFLSGLFLFLISPFLFWGVIYLAFNKWEAMTRSRGSSRTGAFWRSGFRIGRRGRSFSVEGVLFTYPLKREKMQLDF